MLNSSKYIGVRCLNKFKHQKNKAVGRKGMAVCCHKWQHLFILPALCLGKGSEMFE